MKVGKYVKKKIVDQFAGLNAGGPPPVLANTLYDNLIPRIASAYRLKSLDVRCLMLVELFEGYSRWDLIQAGGLHRKSVYKVMDRLLALGLLYSKPAEGINSPTFGRRMYITESGRIVTHEMSRLWFDVTLEAKKRINSSFED